MRSGLVISKRRIIDHCLAKGNDTRVYVDETDPLNPVNVYPIFAFKQEDVGSLPVPSGVIDIRDWETDRKSTRLNSSHSGESRMPSSA